MKKLLFVFALVVTYGVSVSTASAKTVLTDDVKTTVVATDSDDKKADDTKDAKATKADGKAKAKGCSGSEAKAEGCSGKTAKAEGCAGKTAKAEGCSGKTAKAEGCSGKTKTASAGSGCSGEKVAEK